MYVCSTSASSAKLKLGRFVKGKINTVFLFIDGAPMPMSLFPSFREVCWPKIQVYLFPFVLLHVIKLSLGTSTYICILPGTENH